MATYSSTLAWEIPWTEEPGPWGRKRVGHDLATKQQQGVSMACLRSTCSLRSKTLHLGKSLGLETEDLNPSPCVAASLLRVCMCAKVLQSSLTLCDPVDCSLPGSPVHGILQTRIPEWVALSFSRVSSQPGIQFMSVRSPALAGVFFTSSATWEALKSLRHSYIKKLS